MIRATREADLLRYIDELAAGRSLKKGVAVDVGDQEVQVAVAVEVAEVNTTGHAEFLLEGPVIVHALGVETALGRLFAEEKLGRVSGLTLQNRETVEPARTRQVFLGRPGNSILDMEDDFRRPPAWRFPPQAHESGTKPETIQLFSVHRREPHEGKLHLGRLPETFSILQEAIHECIAIDGVGRLTGVLLANDLDKVVATWT